MNLVQPLLNSVPNTAWGSLAGSLHESPDKTRQGFTDAIAMFFAALIGKASTLGGATNLLGLMRENRAGLSHAGGGEIDALMRSRDGGDMAHAVMGDKFGGAASAIANHAGIGLNSAQSLLGLAAPLALGGIAKAAPANGFTAEGLMRFLQGQKDDVVANAPHGLSLGAFGPSVAAAGAQVKRGGGLWPLLLCAAVLAALAFLIVPSLNKRAPTMPVPAPAVTMPDVPNITVPEIPTLQLPGGITLRVPTNSIGYNLANFLGSGQPAPHTFTFDNLNFDTGEVVLTPDSIATLDAIATTLKAYPNATVRLEGHTDTVGDRQANITLSLNRARAVARALTERGVEASRISAAGFGPDKPIASNDTEEGRAANRRLELTVVKK